MVRIRFCGTHVVVFLLQDMKTMKLYCLNHEEVIRRIGELINNNLSFVY